MGVRALVEVTIKEAAAAARVHPDTLARWARSGRILARQYPPRRQRTRRGGPRWLVTLDAFTGRPAVPV